MKKNYRKPYRVRRKKSIFRARAFWLGMLVLAVLGALLYFLFFSDFFRIEMVTVSGQAKVSEEEIKSFVPKRNIFLIDTKEIRKDILDSFPQIAEVEIGRGFPDAINILVIERSGLAVWFQEDKYFLFDNEGVIFEEIQPEPDSVKIIDERRAEIFDLGEKVIEKELLSQILEIRSKVRENLKILILEARIISDERLNAKTSEGWEIYFNLRGDLDWQIQELSLVLEKQISPERRGRLEYIDLRFSRVYYK